MSIDKSIFLKKYYEIPEKTSFICPECNEGKLDILEKNVQLVEYNKSNIEAQKYEDFDIDWLKYSFHGFLVCSNCREKIVFAGKSSVNCRYYFDENDSDSFSGPDYYNKLEIEYIERPPNIIEINTKLPQEIKELLIESFKLFWIDINSCANKIRISLEMLMDLFQVKNYRIKNGKRKFLSLHEKICLFSKNDTSLENILISIKWIGNYASHKDKITKADLLDGFYLLEYALDKIFNNKEKSVLNIAKKINKNKKPRSKIK